MKKGEERKENDERERQKVYDRLMKRKEGRYEKKEKQL